MKKRSLAVLMAGIMAASMMTGVVSVYADADSKTLTVGFDAEYPPFGYKDDNGDYVGFDLDLAQEVCDNLGWELVKGEMEKAYEIANMIINKKNKIKESKLNQQIINKAKECLNY